MSKCRRNRTNNKQHYGRQIFWRSWKSVVIEQFLTGRKHLFTPCAMEQHLYYFRRRKTTNRSSTATGPKHRWYGCICSCQLGCRSWAPNTSKQYRHPALAGLKNKMFKGCLYPGVAIESGHINPLGIHARFTIPVESIYAPVDGDLRKYSPAVQLALS